MLNIDNNNAAAGVPAELRETPRIIYNTILDSDRTIDKKEGGKHAHEPKPSVL
jgi:hypothetical protein